MHNGKEILAVGVQAFMHTMSSCVCVDQLPDVEVSVTAVVAV